MLTTPQGTQGQVQGTKEQESQNQGQEWQVKYEALAKGVTNPQIINLANVLYDSIQQRAKMTGAPIMVVADVMLASLDAAQTFFTACLNFAGTGAGTGTTIAKGDTTTTPTPGRSVTDGTSLYNAEAPPGPGPGSGSGSGSRAIMRDPNPNPNSKLL